MERKGKGENNFRVLLSYRGLVVKIGKGLLEFSNKKINNPD